MFHPSRPISNRHNFCRAFRPFVIGREASAGIRQEEKARQNVKLIRSYNDHLCDPLHRTVGWSERPFLLLPRSSFHQPTIAEAQKNYLIAVLATFFTIEDGDDAELLATVLDGEIDCTTDHMDGPQGFVPGRLWEIQRNDINWFSNYALCPICSMSRQWTVLFCIPEAFVRPCVRKLWRFNPTHTHRLPPRDSRK